MAYPKWLYHREYAPDGLLVAREEDEPSGDGWVTTPAAFDPTYVEPPPLADDEQWDFLARGGRPFVAFPAWRYQANGEAKLVMTAEADEQLDKALWKDTPAAFATAPTSKTPHNATPPSPTPPVPPRPVDRKAKDKE